MEPDHSSSRGRLVFAGSLAVGLAAAVVMILLLGVGQEAEVAEADERCLEAWNSDPGAIGLGIHQSTGHNYRPVRVARLDASDPGLPESATGNCVMVFAATALDPELGSVAMYQEHGDWLPLIDLETLTPERLGELQSGALEGANAKLASDGMITAPL